MQLSIKRQAGATLIEVIMVVALISIITIGALTYYNSANEASKVNQTVSNLTALTSIIRNTFASQGHYQGLTEPMVHGMASTPQTMKGAGTELRHSWSQNSGAVVIAAPTSPFATFSLQLGELPREACQNIASQTLGRFDNVTIGSVTDVTTTAEVMTGCTDDDATNSIIFTVR